MTKKANRKVQLERVSHRAAVQRLRMAYRRLVKHEEIKQTAQIEPFSKQEVAS